MSKKPAIFRLHFKTWKWSCYRVSGILLLLAWIGSVMAADSRTRPVRTEHEAFTPIRENADWDSWPKRIRQDLLLAAGLWPAPSKTPLQTWIGEPRIFDGYAVAGICFQSMPGHWVTGSLYTPTEAGPGPFPGVLSPYGHWPNGRFMDYQDRKGHYGSAQVLQSGGEVLPEAARSLLQARCVALARMGCVVLCYDMIGRADSVQIGHGHPEDPERWQEPATGPDWCLESPRALGHLQSMFGLQTWNGIRAVDVLLERPDIDPRRLIVTGASGGGKQTIFLMAADPRVRAGIAGVALGNGRFEAGCTCGKAPYLLQEHGLVDLIASCSPRPFGLAESDGSKGLRAKVLPFLQTVYARDQAAGKVEFFVNTGYGHTYNRHARAFTYAFLARHLDMAIDPVERPFTFLSQDELTVWSEAHPAPPADERGLAHEQALCRWWAADAQAQLQDLLHPVDAAAWAENRAVIGSAWHSIVGRSLPAAGIVLAEWTDDHGLLRHAIRHELVPVRRTATSTPKRRLVILDPRGRAVLDDPTLAPLNTAGYQLIACDAFFQSADVSWPEGSLGQQVTPYKKSRDGKQAVPSAVYAHYPPTIIRRAHDLLTLLAALRDDPVHGPLPIDLWARPGTAAWAAAALAVDEGLVERVVLDVSGFRFATITDVWAEHFLPGALKYGDMGGLLQQILPRRLLVRGLAEEDHAAVLRAAEQAQGPLALDQEPLAWLLD